MHASDLVDTTLTRLEMTGDEIQAMRQSLVHLGSAVSRVNVQLDGQVEQAQLAHSLQLETSASSIKLANSLTELTSVAQAEIRNISGTAAIVHEQLMAITGHLRYDWMAWGRTGILYLLEIVLRVDPASLEYVKHLPVFRVASVVVRVVYWLFQTSFSSLMSVAVLFMSMRQWLHGASQSRPDVQRYAGYPCPTCEAPRRLCGADNQIACRFTSQTAFFLSLPKIAPVSGNAVLLPHSRRYRTRISRIPDRLCSAAPDPLTHS